MDLREKKTLRSITNAFLQLRAEKALERITVKELAELAQISKATFYLHYRDIYDLSERLQNEVIQEILKSASCQSPISQPSEFTYALCQEFYARQSLIGILFSGSQAAVLPTRIDREMQNYCRGSSPEEQMLLTYRIMGSYFTFQAYHSQYGPEETLKRISQASEAIAGIQ